MTNSTAEAPRATTPHASVKSSERTLQVLEHLAEVGPQSLGELSVALRIPKSSLHGILHTMEHRGWLEVQDGARYGLGLSALLVGSRYVDSDDLVSIASAPLDELAAALGEAVHLGRLDGPNVVYLAKRESPHPLRLFSAVGRRLPAHATALGKCILAWQPEPLTLVPRLEQITERTITDPAVLLEDLATIRARGYAVDDEEITQGIRCFAVPIRRDDAVREAISCSVPLVRLQEATEQAIVAALLTAQQKIEARL